MNQSSNELDVNSTSFVFNSLDFYRCSRTEINWFFTNALIRTRQQRDAGFGLVYSTLIVQYSMCTPACIDIQYIRNTVHGTDYSVQYCLVHSTMDDSVLC